MPTEDGGAMELLLRSKDACVYNGLGDIKNEEQGQVDGMTTRSKPGERHEDGGGGLWQGL